MLVVICTIIWFFSSTGSKTTQRTVWPLLNPLHGQIESFVAYSPAGAVEPLFKPPFDGSIITSLKVNLIPGSRGSITLASSNPTQPPLIDPHYYSTEMDKAVMRTATRKVMQNARRPIYCDRGVS
jgi:choline dehydrogenase-like flavoprotein